MNIYTHYVGNMEWKVGSTCSYRNVRIDFSLILMVVLVVSTDTWSFHKWRIFEEIGLKVENWSTKSASWQSIKPVRVKAKITIICFPVKTCQALSKREEFSLVEQPKNKLKIAVSGFFGRILH